MKLKLKKDDVVRVMTGNDKGKEGRILLVYPDRMRVLVEGVNVRKRHMRPSKSAPEGGIIEREMPIHYSNVMLLSNGKPTRVGVKVAADGGKVRVAKKTGVEI
jgi:large subunit ribosomal protein L24